MKHWQILAALVLLGSMVLGGLRPIQAEQTQNSEFGVKTLTFGHNFDESDPFFRNVIRPWANTMTAESKGTVKFVFESTGITSDQSISEMISLYDVFFYSPEDGPKGFEVLANVPLAATEIPNRIVSEAIWQTYEKLGDDANELYSGARPVGFAAYEPLKVFSHEVLEGSEVTPSDINAWLIDEGNEQEFDIAAPFIVAPASQTIGMLGSLPETSSVKHIELEKEPFGRRAGVILFSLSSWDELSPSMRDLFQNESASYLAELSSYLDSREITATNILRSQIDTLVPNAVLTAGIEKKSNIHAQEVSVTLDEFGVKSDKALATYTEELKRGHPLVWFKLRDMKN